MHNLISFSGIVIIIGFGWLLLTNRWILNWRHPEEQVPKTLEISIKPHYEKKINSFETIINVAQAIVKVSVGVVALLIAVLGLIALLDLILSAIRLRIINLANPLAQHTIQNPRTAVFTSFDLCGFEHLASLSIISDGGFSALASSKTKEFSQIGFRALIATFACLMTACVAGTFFHKTRSYSECK